MYGLGAVRLFRPLAVLGLTPDVRIRRYTALCLTPSSDVQRQNR